MDKITRVLLLYSKLIRGEPVNKLSFCMETDTGGRNFDRDIEDIRLYLSEMYQIDEVLYDRRNNNYYLSGVQRQELEIIEYWFLEHLLIESKVLRRDELAGILSSLASNTKNINKYMKKGIASLANYEDTHSAALLKMHGDIEMMIRDKQVIGIRYLVDKELISKVVIPCNITYEVGHTYLAAFEEHSDDDISYFEMRKIESFRRIRNQNDGEKRRVSEYYPAQKSMTDLDREATYFLKCNKEESHNIKRKFKSAQVTGSEKSDVIIKVVCNEDEFWGWIMGQANKNILLIGPDEATKTLKQKIKEISMLYEKEEKANG
jgi:predicted DNA-binding transcriptional regulator YafY